MYTKYSINHSYFSCIDTEEKAYILGLLYADGCVCSTNNCISIVFQTKDRDLLDIIKTALTSTHPIKHFSTYSLFNFTSKQLKQDLITLGCVPKKSKILQFPEFLILSPLLKHFLRGYFDGDGSISSFISTTQHKNRQKQTQIKVLDCSITSSTLFITKCSEVIKSLLNINTCIKIPHKDKNLGDISSLDIRGRKQIKIFLDFIYSDATIKMERKYNKYLEILNDIQIQKTITCSKCKKPVYSDLLCNRHYNLNNRGIERDTCILCDKDTYGYVNLCKLHIDQLAYYKKINKEEQFYIKHKITKIKLIN